MSPSTGSARAAVLAAYNQPLELREFPLPAELEPGAALVRVTMAGVCGTDVHLWHGQLPMSLPVILGHETVGVIEALSGEVLDWTGQPVVARPARNLELVHRVRPVLLLPRQEAADAVPGAQGLWHLLQLRAAAAPARRLRRLHLSAPGQLDLSDSRGAAERGGGRRRLRAGDRHPWH